MATFFKTSVLWVVVFRFAGRPRVWYRVLSGGGDPEPALKRELAALYGDRAKLEGIRLATPDEDAAYCRGELAPNPMCPVRPRAGGWARVVQPDDARQSASGKPPAVATPSRE